jgi:hypothetical protein
MRDGIGPRLRWGLVRPGQLGGRGARLPIFLLLGVGSIGAAPPQPLKYRCRPSTQIIGLSHRPQSLRRNAAKSSTNPLFHVKPDTPMSVEVRAVIPPVSRDLGFQIARQARILGALFHVKHASPRSLRTEGSKVEESEEGSLARHARATGVPGRTRRLLDNDLVRRRVANCQSGFHTEHSQPLAIPPGRLSSWRFGHHQRSSDSQEGCCALRRNRGRSKAPGYHAVSPASETSPSCFLCPLGHNFHPAAQAHLENGFSEEGSSAGSTIEQDPRGVRPDQGKRETRQPAATTQIHRHRRRG